MGSWHLFYVYKYVVYNLVYSKYVVLSNQIDEDALGPPVVTHQLINVAGMEGGDGEQLLHRPDVQALAGTLDNHHANVGMIEAADGVGRREPALPTIVSEHSLVIEIEIEKHVRNSTPRGDRFSLRSLPDTHWHPPPR